MLIESDGTATEIAALMTAWAAAHQAEWHSLSELAAIGPVSRSSMERAMDKLESLGLVESQRMFNGQGYRLLVTVTMSSSQGRCPRQGDDVLVTAHQSVILNPPGVGEALGQVDPRPSLSREYSLQRLLTNADDGGHILYCFDALTTVVKYIEHPGNLGIIQLRSARHGLSIPQKT